MTLTDVLIPLDATVAQALELLDRNSRQIVLVVDSDNQLKGSVTDGDVRRGLLRGIGLHSPVCEAMQSHPITINAGASRSEALARMRTHGVRQLPAIDAAGKPVELYHLDELLGVQPERGLIVIMAGGLGSRLRPITENVPKPLVNVGGRPVLETTITMLTGQGFRHFLLCVNYMADTIRQYFGDGGKFGVDVSYVDETKRLGTAGALSLLPGNATTPIVVINGDILTTVDFNQLLDFHRTQGAPMTVCVREFTQQIPYGVVRIENDRLASIEEKPSYTAFVSAGIYVLETAVLKLLEHDVHCDMPTLVERVRTRLGPPAVYPIREYWLDIGRMDDLQRAQDDFAKVFGL